MSEKKQLQETERIREVGIVEESVETSDTCCGGTCDSEEKDGE